MNKEYKIYGLKVIGSDEIRYIGYTKRELSKRLYYHLFDAKSGLKYRKCNWIRKNNYNIEIILIEDNLSYKEALDREVYWISQYTNLTNMTKGGDRNPMENDEVRKIHRNVMKTMAQKTSRYGDDNWMTSKIGKEWISIENKKRWEMGVYKTSHDKFKKNIDKEILYDLYIIKGKTIKECSLILNTTYTSIVKNLKRNKIRKYNYGN